MGSLILRIIGNVRKPLDLGLQYIPLGLEKHTPYRELKYPDGGQRHT